MGYSLENARNGKSASKLSSRPSWRPLTLKNKFTRGFEFRKISNFHKFSFFNDGDLKLGHFDFLDKLICGAFGKLLPIIL